MLRGAEWGDEIAQEEIPLSANVITTRVAKTSWGEIFKVTFADIASRAAKRRQILPEYFIATDDHIYLLNEDDNDAAVKKLAATSAPSCLRAARCLRDYRRANSNTQRAPWETTIQLKGDLCVYETNHNSGHFKKVVWKKGVGLVEYSMGYGAAADGFRLKRVTGK